MYYIYETICFKKPLKHTIMKYITLIFFTFLFLNCLAQERISSFAFDQKSTQYIREYEGKYYLIKVSNNNEVTVYDFVSPTNIKNIFSRNIENISTSTLYFFGDKFISSDGLFQTIYNFVKDEIEFLPMYFDSPKFLGWQIKNDKAGVFRSSDFNGFKENDKFYTGSNNSIKELPSSFNYINVYENYLYAKRKNNGVTNEYYMYDVEKSSLEILIEDSNAKHEVSYLQGKAYYLDIDQAVVEYDLAEANRKELGVYSQIKNSNQNAVLKNKDWLYIYNNRADTSFIEVYNYTTKTKISDYKFYLKGGMKDNIWKVVGDKILIQSIMSKFVILDFESNGKIYEHDIAGIYRFDEWPIYDDRYLIVPKKKTIKIIDLNTLADTTTNLSIETERILGLTFFPDDDGLFSFNVQFSEKYKQNTFRVNTDMTVTVYANFGSESLGLSSVVNVTKIGNEIYGLDTNFYNIKENLVTKINSVVAKSDGIFSSKIIGNKIYYYTVKPEGILVYSIENNKETLVTTLNLVGANSIYDIEETSKGLYFYMNPNTIIRHDLDTKKNSIVSKQVDGLNYHKLIKFKDELFFISSNIVNKIAADGTVKQMAIEMNNYGQAIEFRENLFLNNSGRIYNYENGVFKLVHKTESENTWLEKSASRLFFNDFSYSDYRFHTYTIDENGNVDEHMPKNMTEGVQLYTDNAFFSIMYQLNNKRYFVFDHRTGEYANIKEEDIFRNWLGIYVLGQDTIGLISEGNEVVTYKIKNNFNVFEKIDALALPQSKRVQMKYENNYMICFYGNNLVIVNDKGKMTKINVNRGSIEPNTIEYKDGYLYFVAYDEVWGRQFYKYKADEINKTIDNIFITEIAYVYPNPSSGSIKIGCSCDLSVYNDYTVYNQSGIVVQSACLDQDEIDIATLISGTYYLKLKSASKITAAMPFIKH